MYNEFNAASSNHFNIFTGTILIYHIESHWNFSEGKISNYMDCIQLVQHFMIHQGNTPHKYNHSNIQL